MVGVCGLSCRHWHVGDGLKGHAACVGRRDLDLLYCNATTATTTQEQASASYDSTKLSACGFRATAEEENGCLAPRMSYDATATSKVLVYPPHDVHDALFASCIFYALGFPGYAWRLSIPCGSSTRMHHNRWRTSERLRQSNRLSGNVHQLFQSGHCA